MKKILMCLVMLLSSSTFANEALFRAVLKNDYLQVLNLIKNDPTVDLNFTDYNYNTSVLKVAPLHVASANNAIESALILIAAGAKIDLPSQEFQRTPLHIAIEKNNIELVNVLISAGANLNTPESVYRFNSLGFAAIRGRAEIVKLLINAGADLNFRELRNGFTPLMKVIAGARNQEDYNIAKLLIDAGADLSIRSKHTEETALHISVRQLNSRVSEDIAYLLIDAGADVNAKAYGGEYPVLLYSSFRNIDAELVKKLLSNGARVNIQEQVDERRRTALMIFSYNDNLEAVKYLLESGANPNIIGGRGQTALDSAQLIQGPNTQKIVTLLKEYMNH